MDSATSRYNLNASVIGVDHLRSIADYRAHASQLYSNLEQSIIEHRSWSIQTPEKRGELHGDYISLPEMQDPLEDNQAENSGQGNPNTRLYQSFSEVDARTSSVSPKESRHGTTHSKEGRRKGIKRLRQLMSKERMKVQQ